MIATRLLIAVSALATVAACGGGGGGSSRNVSANSTQNPPAVSLSASPSAILAGDSVTLSWSASNADSCDASGGWSGSRSTSGSQIVGPLQQDTSFTLSCSGTGGGAVRQVTVEVDDGGGVSVTLNANPTQVTSGGSSTLTWGADNATDCSASGGWSGTRGISGTFGTGPLADTTNYQLSCSGPSGNATAIVSVQVLNKTLSWSAPTENVDGSALTDLAGYRVYWGGESRSYTGYHQVTTNEWLVTLPTGTYYFAVTAFDTSGNESAYSNELLTQI